MYQDKRAWFDILLYPGIVRALESARQDAQVTLYLHCVFTFLTRGLKSVWRQKFFHFLSTTLYRYVVQFLQEIQMM